MDGIWDDFFKALAAFGVLALTVVGGAAVAFLKAYLDAKRRDLDQRMSRDIAETAVLSVEEDARIGDIPKREKAQAAEVRVREGLEALGIPVTADVQALIQEQVRKMKSWGLEEPVQPKQVEFSGMNIVPQAGSTVFEPDGEAAGYLSQKQPLTLRGAQEVRGFMAAGLTTPRDMQPFGRDDYPMPAGGYEPGGSV